MGFALPQQTVSKTGAHRSPRLGTLPGHAAGTGARGAHAALARLARQVAGRVKGVAFEVTLELSEAVYVVWPSNVLDLRMKP